MNPRLPVADRFSGFTLVELVIVIAITGVVAVLASTLVGRQMEGYVDTSRRATLVAKADAALRQMARELRNAVPYSIRISGNAIEWIPIETFGRYRRFSGAMAEDPLDFSSTDTQFDVIGPLPALAAGQRLVIGNTPAAASGFNVYQNASDGSVLPAGAHVITPASMTPSTTGSAITLGSGFQFSQDSVASRFYVVSGAASYICNPVSGQINRYASYGIQSSQPVATGAAPLSTASTALLVDSVSSCSFGYTSLDLIHGLVTLQLQLSEGGETISLVRVIQVENRP